MGEKVLALAGGVGGAKLALGLARVLPPGDLVVCVNTGDDECFHGLHVSPDLDTVMYTLAGLANPETGWGLEGVPAARGRPARTEGARAGTARGAVRPAASAPVGIRSASSRFASRS